MDAPPAAGRLRGLRALVTMADRYTGPAVIERLEAEGAFVIGDVDGHRTANGPQGAVDAAGQRRCVGGQPGRPVATGAADRHD